MNIPKQYKFHFVGIGGIGMSAIAQIMHNMGYKVSGCDAQTGSKIVLDLKASGCAVHQGHSAEHLDDIDFLVYSSDIAKDNPEIVAAKKLSIKIVHRSLLLGELMKNKFSIAVAGSHGKTTTTSLIAHMFISANLDPYVLSGGIIKNINSNSRSGNSNYLVAEACESDRSFLNFFPTIAIITNIDNEHMAEYKDIDDLKETFAKFIARLPFYGKAVVCIDDKNTVDVSERTKESVITYGLSEDATVRGEIIELRESSSLFKAITPAGEKNFMIPIPGKHNVQNALAAIAIGLEVELTLDEIAKTFETFLGVERRFDFIGKFKGADVYDDYGHHPTEIQCTLNVARKKSKGRLVVAFQPQRYSRTSTLWKDFIETLSNSHTDTLFITDIYSAGEAPIADITSENLVKEILIRNSKLNVIYVPKDILETRVKEFLKEGDLFLTLGAGKLDSLAKKLVN